MLEIFETTLKTSVEQVTQLSFENACNFFNVVPYFLSKLKGKYDCKFLLEKCMEKISREMATDKVKLYFVY
jgi:hypothetical protein